MTSGNSTAEPDKAPEWWKYSYWTKAKTEAVKRDAVSLMERLVASSCHKSPESSVLDRLLALIEHLESELETANYERNTRLNYD